MTTTSRDGSEVNKRSGLYQAILIFAIFIGFMAAVQFASSDLPDNDGYYHIRLAEQMRTQGLKPNFPWLPLSILNEREFSDHHFLFHVALIPFTFGDLRLGAKWASVIFAGLAFLSVWWLFYRQKVPYAALWAFGLLAISEAFIYRMSITRAQSLSLAFLALGLSLLLSRQYRWLLPFSFAYVWLYDAFPLVILLVASYTLAVLLLEKRFEYKPALYAGIGMVLGVVVNPYFPDNFIFLIRHLAPKLTEATSVSVGSEWYPYTTAQLLQNSPLALVAFLAGVIALGLNNRRMDVPTATSFFMTALFGLMLFQSRRFIEYFPPFALIFCAFAWKPLIESFLLSRKTEPMDVSTAPDWKHKAVHRLQPWLPVILLVIVFLGGMVLTLREARASIRTSKPYALFAGSSAWLKSNTEAGERVFQTDWDDFPRLFYYNTRNTYLIGLDPTYMQLYNSELYDQWVEITRGEIEQPARLIHDRFGASYVISDLRHDDFIRQAQADEAMVEVYRDDNSVVYEIQLP